MGEITIGPKTQLVALLGVVGGVAALTVSQLPEIRRYLRLRSM